MKTNYLECGDAATMMRTLPNGSVNLLIADPPYNLGKDYGNSRDMKAWHEYEDFTREWLSVAVPLLDEHGSLYVFMGVRFISKLFAILEDELKLMFNGWITWHYTQGMGRKVGFSPRHEDILYFTRTDRFTFNLDAVRIPQKYFRKRNNMMGANPGDVWQFSHVHYCSAEREPHPTQKPEALIERMILASSNKGDAVLDPFVGSGTTCRVADALKRRWIGFDRNPDYVAMSRKRMSENAAGFDSSDPRVGRTPKDLPRDDGRMILPFPPYDEGAGGYPTK
jgi:site-specific DNA-methyltransferase (adenine-specific)